MASTYDKVFLSAPIPPKPKRIVICCDGTWQSATSLDPKQGCPSNVARLSRVLANAGVDRDGKEWQQVIYYDSGVGTGDLTDYEKKRQGGLGIGLLENVIEAYNFIVNNYCLGDELFFFGFSRGAYTVRSAAGLVCQIGVIHPSSMRSFLRLYNTYITEGKFDTQFNESKIWQDYITSHPDYSIVGGTDLAVKVVGVWDTVGSLGVPDMGHLMKKDNSSYRKAYQFHDVELNDSIQHAYQALALDEQRRPFSPSIWKARPGGKTKLCQCWFPGAHINVGGGSDKNADEANPQGDREQLASISYAWMLDRIRPHLALDEAALEAQKTDILEAARTPNLQVAQKPEEKGWFWGSVSYVTGAISSATSAVIGKEKTQSVMNAFIPYSMGTIDDSHTFMYDVMGSPEPRTPGMYHDQSSGMYTVERVHPSVYFRQEYQRQFPPCQGSRSVYVPAAMKGWIRKEELHGYGTAFKARKGWKWVKYAIKPDGNAKLNDKGEPEVLQSLWEFEIGMMPENDSIEKWLIDNSWCESIHKEVQKGWRSG